MRRLLHDQVSVCAAPPLECRLSPSAAAREGSEVSARSSFARSSVVEYGSSWEARYDSDRRSCRERVQQVSIRPPSTGQGAWDTRGARTAGICSPALPTQATCKRYGTCTRWRDDAGQSCSLRNLL